MELTAVQSWGEPYTDTKRWYIRVFPSLTDFAFLLPLFLICFPGIKSLLADADTGWHIKAGEWILQHGTIPTLDIFSFTKPHEPWFDWEWGWDVLFAWIHQAGGLTAVTFTTLVLLCVISALLYRLIRRCSGNDILALLFTATALLGSTIHWLARPHLFSWLFVLLFSHLLLSSEEGDAKVLWLLPLLTLCWVNIHGAFFVGIFMVLTSATGEAIGVFVREKQMAFRLAFSKARPYLVTAAGCLAASFINPYTWHLHWHLLGYLRDFKLLDQIQEYQSISFHHGPVIFFECMLLLGAAAAGWCLNRARFGPAILILVWAHLALVAARNIPIFLFCAAPWIACMIGDKLKSIESVAWLNKFRSAFRDSYAEFQIFERMPRCYVASLGFVLCMACLFAKGDPTFQADFDPKRFPVHAIPVIESSKAARVFTYDQWGDYLIYRLYPSNRVFVDGRGELYGADFLTNCLHLFDAQYDWANELRHFDVDTVLLRPETPLATALKASPNWKVLFDDGSAIVFRDSSEKQHEAPAVTENQIRFSPVSRNGGKGLEGWWGLQVHINNSHSITHERRS